MRPTKIRQYTAYPMLFGFLLGIHNGNIALWKDNDPQPLRVFPYSANALPRQDQDALRRGIEISDSDDLARLLEDYLS